MKFATGQQGLMRNDNGDSDSRKRVGGRIPGTPGIPAYALSGPEPTAIPVLIAVPHAGRAYPPVLLREMRQPQSAALKLEDRYVDRLAQVVARETGSRLLVANAPRAMIDLNRSPDDIDWEMFGKADRPDVGSYTPSRRARSGLGLIPRRVPGIGELWKRRHEESDLSARICNIHEPYHEALSQALVGIRERWGAALLVDMHSMPPIAPRAGLPGPQFVIGDRFGASSHGSLVAAAFSHLDENGRLTAHNRPYSGGYVLERHGDQQAGIHALQLEIDRATYLDSRLAEPGPGFDKVAQVLVGLVRKLADGVSALGGSRGEQGWQEAAE